METIITLSLGQESTTFNKILISSLLISKMQFHSLLNILLIQALLIRQSPIRILVVLTYNLKISHVNPTQPQPYNAHFQMQLTALPHITLFSTPNFAILALMAPQQT